MISAGTKITSSADVLKKIPLDYLYHSIKNPKAEIEAKIRQLRVVRDIDPKKYSLLKKELPYIVCGMFSPPFRRAENFAYTEYFMVDIDHITQKQLSISTLRDTLQSDTRVTLSFLSPGEDGLKLLFKLKERCYDAGLYSIFYKAFVIHLSQTYSLEQVIDKQTSDVSRACFISIDHDAYFNPNAEAVDMSAYLNVNDPISIFSLKNETEKVWKESEVKKDRVDPDEEAINRIKDILKMKKPIESKPPVYVPEQLNEIIEDLRKYVEESGIVVSEIINISYGKKIRMKMGNKQAEINVFYGRKGFSVVESPRTGTIPEFNKLTAELIKSFFWANV